MRAISIPANCGEMSKWLTLKPEYIPPFKPTPTVKMATVSHLLQPVNDAPINAMAGPNCPEKKFDVGVITQNKFQYSIDNYLSEFQKISYQESID